MASTVLPNGIIVPEKFSRDWYADLYHNWQELDNLLGGGTPKDGTLTIQKNGDTVGTFSANQATDETVNIEVPDVNNGTLTIQQNGTTVDSFSANKEFTGTTTAHDVIPSATDTYNFGSPSYQWNNAYIKSLTINGVACGDILTHNVSEFVKVTGNQTIDGQKIFSTSPRVTKTFPDIALNISDCDVTEIPTEVKYASLYFRDKNNKNLAYIVGQQRVDGTKRMCIRTHRTDNINNYYSVNFDSDGNFNPEQSNSINLGTFTSKWKSFNGINPGALSLPSRNYISLDTTGFDVTATTIGAFTSTVDGWAILSISQKNKPFGIWIIGGSYKATFYSVHNNDDYFIFALIPVRANINMDIYCTADDIDSTRKVSWLRLFPCQ